MKVLILITWVTFLNTMLGYAQSIDSAQLDRSKELVQHKLDSVNGLSNKSFDSVSRITNYAQNKLDSLSPQNKLNSYEAKLHALKSRMTSKIDSLGSLQHSDSALTNQLTKLRTKLDSIKNLGPAKDVSQAQERIAALENGLDKKVKTVEGKVNEKMGLFAKNGGNMPGGVNLPGANLSEGLSVPGVNIPTVENSLGKLDSPDLNMNGNLPGAPKIPDAQIGDIKALEGVGDVQEKLGSATQVSSQVSGYQDDLKNLQQGDLANVKQLPDALESKVEGMDQLKGFKEQTGGFETMKKNWSDPQVMKEEALNKAKESAINHFAGHEEELKTVMEQMSKLKSKVPDPQGPIDLFKKRQQFMKEKPIVERFVPGFTFQFQKQQSFWVDLNLYAGFKISGRWLAGLGWNERLAYNFKDEDWDNKKRIYGIRSFVHFKLRENIWLKADVEDMNAPFRPHGFKSNGEIVGRKWIWSYLIGMKKDFQFSKSFKGNVQMLYNIYDPEKDSPYLSKFNVRMGFEWQLRKKQKNISELHL